MPRKSATATKVGDPEPVPFETRGSHSSGVGGSRTAPPDIDRIARETPSRVLGVRDPGLQADVCNEMETSARHRRDPSLQGVRLGQPTNNGRAG